MVRMVYPFLPVLGRGLGVDLWLMSLAITLRSLAGSVGPFLASIADSQGRKTGMLLGLLLFIAGVGIIAVWPSYPALVLALILTLVGNFVFIPAMQASISDRVIYQKRGRALALTEFGWSLSFILGVPLMGFLIARFGWRAPFPILTGLGLLAFGVLAWMLPRDPAPTTSQPGLWKNFRTVLTCSPALAGLLMGLALSAANEMVNVVFGVWMEDSFGLKVTALGAASAIIGLSELGGESLVTLFIDRLGKSRSVATGLLLNCLTVLGLAFAGRHIGSVLVGLFFFYLTFEFTIVSTTPLMSEVLPEARATLMAIFIASMSLGRAISDLSAARLYLFGKSSPLLPGIFSIALMAILFNLLALAALQQVRIKKESLEVQVEN